tara:strand:- start:409 stop:1173 length:765 start_codon:yes stop_codon:yes gene_type:complete
MDVTQDSIPQPFVTRTETGAGITDATYTTSEFSLAPSLYALQYSITDLVPVAGSPIDVERVAANLVAGVGLTMTDLLCALFGSLSNSVGTTTVDLTVSDIFDAVYQLNSSNVSGNYAAVLYPQQFNDFQNSLRAEAGAVQFAPASEQMLAAKGPGFKGSWLNIDFYQSDSVGTANGGADSAGAMFGAGAFAYTLADPRVIQGHIPSDSVLMANEVMLLEMSRDSANFKTALVGQIYPAVVEAEDARGVKIVTDR